MSVSSLSSAGLDPRRRRILFRCRRRGIREMDIALGNFAETHLQGLTEEQLAEFERWLDAADPDLPRIAPDRIPGPQELKQKKKKK